eukprot:4553_1
MAIDLKLQTTMLIAACYLTFMLIPLSCYWIVQVFPHRNQIFIQKRNVKMIFLFTTSWLVFIIGCDLVMLFMWLNIQLFIPTILLFISIGMCEYCLMCKTWMVFYDYKWTYYTLQTEWASIIDSSSHSTNWYLKHRKTFGNWSWFCKFMAAVYIVSLAVMFVSLMYLVFSGNLFLTILGIILSMIPLFSLHGSYMIILYRTPNLQKFSDRFFIHWESKLVAKLNNGVVTTAVLLFSGCGVFWMAFPLLAWYIIVLGLGVVYPSFCAAIVYSSSKLIIDKNIAIYGDGAVALASVDSSNMSPAVVRVSHMSLIAVLSNKEALHLFMLHLSKEYSMEILLSYIEFNQYLSYLDSLEPNTSNNEYSMSNEDELDLNSLVLLDSVPTSSIVNNDHGFKEKAYALYSKYIARGCEYEINISGKLRNEFTNIVGHYQLFMDLEVEIAEMRRLFTACKHQLVKYLSYSHSRFAKTEEYAAVTQLISPPDSQMMQ